MKNQASTASWINVAVGVWLIMAPSVLGYTSNVARTNDTWLGIIIGAIALIRAFTPVHWMWLSWVNVLAGIWLIIAPFVLGYPEAAPIWNDVIVGIIVGGLAIWGSSATGIYQARHGGHARI